MNHSLFDSGHYASRMPSQEEKNKGKNPMNQRLRKGAAMVRVEWVAYGDDEMERGDASKAKLGAVRSRCCDQVGLTIVREAIVDLV